jgi:hypothetical protein
MSSIQNLLTQVSDLQSRENQIARLKGENFNIFSIMRNERDEVGVHNRFIAEMLNPKGSHGLGDASLKAFFEYINDSDNFGSLYECKQKRLFFDDDNSFKCKTEHFLGTKKNKPEPTGGYVDVALMSKDYNVFIESKIGAGDQENQILRYYNDGKNKSNVVIYLTLNGKASESGKGLKANEHYLTLSYREDIVNWLTIVKQKATDFPMVRESIQQYINLLKKLTGQLHSQQMQENLLELIGGSAENYKAAKLIANNFEQAKINLYKSILNEIKINSGQNFRMDRCSRKDAAFVTLKNSNYGNNNYDIGLQIELDLKHVFFCAIKKGGKRNGINKENQFNDLSEELLQKFLSRNKKRNQWYLAGAFSIDFTLERYVEMKDPERKVVIQNIGKIVNQLINESKLTTNIEK